MIENVEIIFGTGKELNILNMCSRALIVFIFSLILVRILGRRTFSLGAPIDNIVLILLGSILARSVVGASPFIPTLAASILIAMLHRTVAFLSAKYHVFGKLTKGEKIPLYQNGATIPSNLIRALISHEDMMEEIRLRALVNSFDSIESVYMERNGEISSVKKQN